MNKLNEFEKTTEFNPQNAKYICISSSKTYEGMQELNNGTYIIVSVPLRLHVSLLNINIMTEQGVGGGIGISIKSDITMKIEISSSDEVDSVHNKVIMHYLEVMRQILNVNNRYKITVNGHCNTHVGLGSTICLISALCFGINTLYGNPIEKSSLVQIIRENYCEESGEHLIYGHDSGVGAITCLHGGINIVGNDYSSIYNCRDIESVVLYFQPTSESIMTYENEVRYLMALAGEYENKDIKVKTKMIMEDLIQSIKRGEIKEIGRIISSINTLGSKKAEIEIQKRLTQVDYDNIFQIIIEGGCEIVGMSSAGPTIYAISGNTRSINNIISRLEQMNLSTSSTYINNEGISILEKGTII